LALFVPRNQRKGWCKLKSRTLFCPHHSETKAALKKKKEASAQFKQKESKKEKKEKKKRRACCFDFFGVYICVSARVSSAVGTRTCTVLSWNTNSACFCN
jgi:radical SAM superfamily enzyme